MGGVRVQLAAATLLGAGLAVPVGAPPPAVADPADTAVAPGRAVIGTEVIGRSVRGRAIPAFHLGEPGPGVPTVVLVSTMHGDERRTRHILTSLRDGAPVRGVDLWVVPTYNPDGFARATRHNARGVDLNRNYPTRWRRAEGRYDSGRAPASEPETRAMMRFLRRVDPDYVLSFHQPLHGVDTLAKRPAFAQRVARTLRLPRKTFSCNGGCRGTMTMWFNATFRGVALTVEYGARPALRELRGPIARRVLRVFGAAR